jgi:LacI family transcriptional regulator
MEHSPSMREIAVRAGVDRSTVSRALKNDPRLKPTTCTEIQRLATQMGYRQNPVVANLMSLLRAGQERHFQSTIAVVHFGKRTVGSNKMVAGARQRANALGYYVEEFDAYEVSPSRLEHILISRGIRGIIITSRLGKNVLPQEYEFVWERFSCCVVGIRPENPPLNFVADDNYATMMTAIRQLHNLGFRKIGLALHDGINRESEYRFLGGYLTGTQSYCSEVTPMPVFLLTADSETKTSFLTWYEENSPDVIICIQKEPLDWLKQAGYRVPRDVSLISLDLDSVGTEWAGMYQDERKRGELAIEEVVGQISNNQTGISECQKATLNESKWQLGSTLEMPSVYAHV